MNVSGFWFFCYSFRGVRDENVSGRLLDEAIFYYLYYFVCFVVVEGQNDITADLHQE